MISKILDVARRDFTAVVGSKGFMLGLLIMPLLMVAVITIGPRIANAPGPQVRGEVAVIDLSGAVNPELQIPDLTIVERPATADISNEKQWLVQEKGATPAHLALLVIKPDAVMRGPGKKEYGSYDLYASRGLGDRTESSLHDALRKALVAARLKNKSLDPVEIEATMQVQRPNAIIVGASGENASRRGLTRMLPFICGILLFIGVFTAGQGLMTSMIEEKSNRVVEVLLAAVSPLELMWGKLLAQLGVCLLLIAVYCGLGLMALVQFATLGLIDPMLLVYLAIFFILAYLIFGALMLMVGAAVNQIADTQALMGPIMLLLLAPYALTPMIGRAPNSTLATAMSFIPPMNSFVMLARIASDAPPPFWQVALSVVVGLAAALLVLWFAAKIFRIGLLMHGKPPNVATLIRWARMA